jgi:hypothetical protein
LEIFNDKGSGNSKCSLHRKIFLFNALNAYMIRQSALWLTTSSQIDSWKWEMALEVHERFGAGVAVHIAKVYIK